MASHALALSSPCRPGGRLMACPAPRRAIESCRRSSSDGSTRNRDRHHRQRAIVCHPGPVSRARRGPGVELLVRPPRPDGRNAGRLRPLRGRLRIGPGAVVSRRARDRRRGRAALRAAAASRRRRRARRVARHAARVPRPAPAARPVSSQHVPRHRPGLRVRRVSPGARPRRARAWPSSSPRTARSSHSICRAIAAATRASRASPRVWRPTARSSACPWPPTASAPRAPRRWPRR